jgi:hypothetical protein
LLLRKEGQPPMPLIQAMELPRPKNWQDFETMVCDAMTQRWNSPALQKNGRPGQKQNGVDIYGPDEIGRRVGIQCKRYKLPFSLKTVEDEIAAAETFGGHLTTLYVATTSENDSKLQREVRKLSDKRVAADRFAVSIIFWDDVVRALLLNPTVFKAHYPQVILPTANISDRDRQLAALELGYYGTKIWEYVVLVYGEYGRMAQTDPDELIATIRTLERRVSQLLNLKDAAPILKSLRKVRKGCLAKKTTGSDWDQVEVHAKRVQTRLGKASSLLSATDGQMLELAAQLGRIYHHVDDLPSKQIRRQIEEKIRGLLPARSANAIKERFAAAKKVSSGYTWATRIYGLLDHELRWASS